MVRERGVGDNDNGLQELRDQFHNRLLVVVEGKSLKGQSLVEWMGKQMRDKILPEAARGLQPSGEVVFLVQLNFGGGAPDGGWTWSHFQELGGAGDAHQAPGLLSCGFEVLPLNSQPLA